MNETWFDIQYIDISDGALLEDDIAEKRIAAQDDAVKHIGELLKSKLFGYTREDFDSGIVNDRRITIAGWDSGRCRAFGAWIRWLAETDGNESHSVIEQHLRRLGVMGLGLEEKPIFRILHVSSMAEFRREIGAPIGRRKGEYRLWGVREYAKYAVGLSTKLGRKPEQPDYIAAAQRGEGPGLEIIRYSPVHTISNLNELADFPDVNSMDSLDLVLWGCKVRKANDGKRLSTLFLQILSKRKRGPSLYSIYSSFDNWSDYSEQVDEQFERELEQSRQSDKLKLELYSHMIDHGDLPEAAKSFSQPALFELGGKYRLVRAFIPKRVRPNINQLISKRPDRIIPAIMRQIPDLDAGNIETEAVLLGIFDDIWPIVEDSRSLVVSNEELITASERINTGQRARYGARK